MVEHVLAEHDFTVAPGELQQVEQGRAHGDPTAADGGDLVDVGKGPATSDAQDEPGDGRVRLLTVPAGHDVGHPADGFAGLVAHGAADQAGDRNETVANGPNREQALAALAAG